MTRAAAWGLMRRWGPWALALLVLVLLARQAHRIDWQGVGDALREQPPVDLAIAVGLALCSHLLFASYEWIGRRMTGHAVGPLATLRIGAICYAFTLNFGSLVGGVALKLRLYGRAGLKPAIVGRLIGYSLITNWLGYLLVGGTVLAAWPPQLGLPQAGLRLLGIVMLGAGGAWLLLCWRSPRRRLVVRGVTFELPPAGIALWQAAVAAANWLLMGAIVWLLLQQRAEYTTVLAVLLAGAIAGVITHVPAGLGVLEAVFLSAFTGHIDHGPLLAALLAYRAAYYLLPLVIAAAAYGWTEARPWRRHAW